MSPFPGSTYALLKGVLVYGHAIKVCWSHTLIVPPVAHSASLYRAHPGCHPRESEHGFLCVRSRKIRTKLAFRFIVRGWHHVHDRLQDPCRQEGGPQGRSRRVDL